MPDTVHALLEITLLWLAVALAASCLCALAYPMFRRINQRYPGALRARQLMVYALLVPLTATLLVALAMQPERIARLVPQHCHDADCAPHRPQVGLASAQGVALVGLAGLGIIAFLGLLQEHLSRGKRQLRALQLLSSRDPDHDCHIVDNPGMLAWSAGWLRPRVYLSRGLRAVLNAEQLSAVLAHEQAHAARRDNLRTLVLRSASIAWPGQSKCNLWADFAHATEEACDRDAANRLGSATPVVHALQALEHAAANAPAIKEWSFDMDHRVRTLLSGEHERSCAFGGWLLVAALLGINVILLAGATHYALELISAVPFY